MSVTATGSGRFWSNERGNVALAFGLALVPMVGAAGLVFDLQTAGNSRQMLQTEADAAALEVTKAVVEIQTSAANASKTQQERSALIDQRATQILAARQAIAEARTSGNASNVSMSGRWDDALKTEYSLTASANVKRYFNIAGMGGNATTVPVRIGATAKMEVKTSYTTSVPTLANPGFEAGDYNRIYAYCYDETKKNDANRGRSKMTPVSSNGATGNSEMNTNNVFRNVQMPVCEGSEILSWRLYNVRNQRTNANAWPQDRWNNTTKLWEQTDRSGYEIYNHYSDTKINASTGLEEYAFTGNAFSYNQPIKMMETKVCDTMDQCTPGRPGAITPSGRDRNPDAQNMACAPGKFMYIGWEDRPFLMKNTALNDYSTNNSYQWTDSDYDDITLVISCPEKKITQYTSKIWLAK